MMPEIASRRLRPQPGVAHTLIAGGRVLYCRPGPPLVNGGELFSKVFPFAVSRPEMAVPKSPYFWRGMQPKEGRVAYASFPGLATRPTLLLLKDPPEVPDYWFISYEQMARQPGAD
jgi:hypothetical protein